MRRSSRLIAMAFYNSEIELRAKTHYPPFGGSRASWSGEGAVGAEGYARSASPPWRRAPAAEWQRRARPRSRRPARGSWRGRHRFAAGEVRRLRLVRLLGDGCHAPKRKGTIKLEVTSTREFFVADGFLRAALPPEQRRFLPAVIASGRWAFADLGVLPLQTTETAPHLAAADRVAAALNHPELIVRLVCRPAGRTLIAFEAAARRALQRSDQQFGLAMA